MEIKEVRGLLRDKYPELFTKTGEYRRGSSVIEKVREVRALQVKLRHDGLVSLESKFTKSTDKHTFRCKKCNDTWEATYDSVGNKKGHGCPACAGNKGVGSETLVKYIKTNNLPIKIVGNYINANTPIALSCSNCEHVWSTSPKHVIHSQSSCPSCSGRGQDILYMWQLASNPNIVKIGVTTSHRKYMARAKEVAAAHETYPINYCEIVTQDARDLEDFISSSLQEYRAPYSTIKEADGHTEMFTLPAHIKEQLWRLINDKV